MKIKTATVFIIALYVVMGTIPVVGDDGPIRIIVTPQDTLIQVPVREPIEGLDNAERLMQLGYYDRAVEMLEGLYYKHPDNNTIKQMLTICYENTKEYGKLQLFLKHRLETEGPSFLIYQRLGRAYVLSGLPDSAGTFFHRAVELSPNKERAVANVAEEYHKSGYYRLETIFIDSVRVLLGDPALAADYMGDAMTAQRLFAQAAQEYLTYMEKDSLTAKAGTERIIGMLRYPESTDTVMAILSERIKEQKDNNYLLDTYGNMLLQNGRFDEALAYFADIEKVREGTGGKLVYYMRVCNEMKEYQATIRAGQYMFAEYPASSLLNGVRFEMADAYIGLGQYTDALAMLKEITGDQMRPANRIEAQYKMGILYKDKLGDLQQAQHYLNGVIKLTNRGTFAVLSQIALADLAVRERQFDSAVVLYEQIRQQELPDEMNEQIDFALAEIFIFKEDFAEAQKRFRQVISRYPRGFYVNDAIQYSLIIQEALAEAEQQMDLFAASEFYRFTNRADSLEYYLTKICKIKIASLAPISHLRLAELYREQGRIEETIAALDELVNSYPDSYYRPYGLKLKADIYLQTAETREQALEMYRDLLQNYGTYPFAAEIRNVIRKEAAADRI